MDDECDNSDNLGVSKMMIGKHINIKKIKKSSMYHFEKKSIHEHLLRKNKKKDFFFCERNHASINAE